MNASMEYSKVNSSLLYSIDCNRSMIEIAFSFTNNNFSLSKFRHNFDAVRCVISFLVTCTHQLFKNTLLQFGFKSTQSFLFSCFQKCKCTQCQMHRIVIDNNCAEKSFLKRSSITFDRNSVDQRPNEQINKYMSSTQRQPTDFLKTQIIKWNEIKLCRPTDSRS